MPCSDVTEVIALRLDPHDRLRGYELRKRTCGAEIGRASLLMPWLGGRPATDVLALHGDDLLTALDPSADEEMLYFKHLVALQQALAVLLGLEPGGPGRPCTAAEIFADGDEVGIVADLPVQLLTERIEACARCCRSVARRAAGGP